MKMIGVNNRSIRNREIKRVLNSQLSVDIKDNRIIN